MTEGKLHPAIKMKLDVNIATVKHSNRNSVWQ